MLPIPLLPSFGSTAKLLAVIAVLAAAASGGAYLRGLYDFKTHQKEVDDLKSEITTLQSEKRRETDRANSCEDQVKQQSEKARSDAEAFSKTAGDAVSSAQQQREFRSSVRVKITRGASKESRPAVTEDVRQRLNELTNAM